VAQLTHAERAQYESEGWVVPAFRLSAARVQALQQALDDLIARNPGVRPEKLVSAHIEGDNGEGVRGSAAFLDLARDPDIVDLVAGVIGDDVILWGCHVFCKPAGVGYETPWHQDGHYWPIRPLATCTAWVALEPSTRENGCLRVIPRSHAERRLYPHLNEDRSDLTLNLRAQHGSFDEATAIDIELQPGRQLLRQPGQQRHRGHRLQHEARPEPAPRERVERQVDGEEQTAERPAGAVVQHQRDARRAAGREPGALQQRQRHRHEQHAGGQALQVVEPGVRRGFGRPVGRWGAGHRAMLP
jgi:hypothetical protein